VNTLEACSGFSIFAIDLDAIVRLWSDGAAHLYGYERAEIVGQPSSVLHVAADLARGVPEQMLDSARQAGSWVGPIRRRRKDGRQFTARVSVTSMLGFGGSLEGFLLVSSDLSPEERLADELELERHRERMLFEASADAMIIVGPEGLIQRANGASEALFGYGKAELVDQPIETLMPVPRRAQHVKDRAAFAADPRAREMAANLKVIGLRKDLTEVPLEIRLTPHENASGPVVTAEIRDVSERNRVAQALADAHQQAAQSLGLLESIQAAAPVGLGFVDRDFRIVNVNARLAAMQGSQPERLLGLTLGEAMPERWAQLEPVYRQILRTGEPVITAASQGEDISYPGESRSWLTSYYPVTVDGKVTGIGQVTLDVTATRRADDLRVAVMQSMAEGMYVMDSEGRLILINAAGSAMLGWTQEELLGKPLHDIIHFQHVDGTPCREDSCELLKLRLDGAAEQAGEDAFTAKDGHIIPVAYSASPLLDGSSTRAVVVAFRDITEERDARESARQTLDSLSWIGRTRDALDEDRLVLYSQPIVPLRGAPPRAELLVRMIGRGGEIISPDTFLPGAEQYGLIGDIDRWVIAKAITLAADGRRVQFNLSAQSVADRGLLASIEHQLHETGTEPENLVFEITETALMNDITAGERFVRAVTDLGCGVALDDFGMGFGSFTYLKRLPVTCLKIDIEFVRNLTTNRTDQHLVKAIVNLAEGFGQQTVAEGVENEQTLQLLREYGVDFAQGFHVGRPGPIVIDSTDDNQPPAS
jgi:PAS domain S-box-containing protein